MHKTERRRALARMVDAAEAAGALLRRHFLSSKKVNEQHQHDIKLELDVASQKLIERRLGKGAIAVLGEEGTGGAEDAELRWVIDPIDGTVNFAYQIPHAAISIALQERSASAGDEGYRTIAGVVLDPFMNETWTAVAGEPARLNGRKIQASSRAVLDECVVSIGFAKDSASLRRMLPAMNGLVKKVRKVRLMGSAALAMVYVASGRFDAYIESGIRLWDVAAGGLILEQAGGEFWRKPVKGVHAYEVVANNGLLRKKLERYL